ncbi:AI-2E family transporter [Arachidicoccus ginsenosidivorans]|jgi:predicted PurR-regulated permease PerM|uniref:AI-2E family transporter n=1 Tax=Arachidicoccus ginsenosidivorans TaxID=496057 RepID=A0A5B8VNQ4_9BACT|nr:AI-2E family transporter [Arachidicoccus ginsenosidivorans]QEC72843.1 AI-2E family transporter [Arachidicoccus ginsenosidivorans]
MEKISTNLIKQVVLLILITFIGIEIIVQLKYFLPGFFGAITLYVLYRSWYYKLIEQKHWKKWAAALVLILGSIILVVLPIFSLIKVLIPRINQAIEQAPTITGKLTHTLDLVKNHFPSLNVSNETILENFKKLAAYIPKILNATASVVSNLAVAFFIFYFMLMGGRKMEEKLESFLPLSQQNKSTLWQETRNMVVSNAIGIPVLAVCQALLAILGYWIFGIKEFIFWGLLTGAASIIPVVGTMIVWVPICIITMAGGEIGMGLGLLAYCGIVVSNSDNVLRFALMKKFGDVHPLITVFGVILGLQLFGLMGLIFGPLMIAYFLLLCQIYKFEYGSGSRQNNKKGAIKHSDTAAATGAMPLAEKKKLDNQKDEKDRDRAR